MTTLPASAVGLGIVRTALASIGRESVRSATLIPNPRPAVFVRADSSPPVRETLVTQRVGLAVQIWAPSAAEAASLAEDLYEAIELDNRTQDSSILMWDPGIGPHSWPDPDDSSTSRWQFTGTFTYSI